MGAAPIEELIDLPLMNDPASLATLDVLTKFYPSAMFTDANLLSMTVCRAVNLSLEQGHSAGSCVAYVWFAKIAGPHFDDYKAGFRFGQLGFQLVEKRGFERFQARTSLWFAQFVLPWTKHIQGCRELIRRALEAATKAGDLIAAVYSFDNLNTNFLAAGDPLLQAQRQAENGLELAERAQFGHVIATQVGLIRSLRGLTYKFGCFDDGQLNEVALERHFAASPALKQPESWYWIRKLQARYFAGDYPAALDAAARAEPILWTSAAMFETAEYHFYAALSHAASCTSVASGQDGPTSSRPSEHVAPDSRETEYQHFEALAAHHRQLEAWAENCPDNFENRAALVGAEIARIEGRLLEAEQLYEQAIRSARSNGFVNNEAIAYEIAARFYAARGFQKFADAYLREARYCYQRWGADGKVAQIDCVFPHLKNESLSSTPTTGILASTELLDLATVIKVSQAVSGDMVLEKLIDSLLRAAMQQAGAERGLLILPQGDQLLIEAEAIIAGNGVTMHQGNSSVDAEVLPESIVRYVIRSQEHVILADASSPNPFSADSYIAQRRPRSVLTLPLINQGKVIGILHFENNLTPHVFSPDRITVLKVLASRAAISLENARLYRDLEDRERKIRRLIDANIIGIVIWDMDGRLIDANDAFLRMVGYEREDLEAGLGWFDMTPPEWQEAHARYEAEELKATGMMQAREKEYFRKDGSRVPVLIGAACFEGQPNQGVAYIIDLSEQKRAEEALRQTQEELRDTQTQFAHANRVMTMGELTASIAHEVSQPLAAIIASGDSCTAWLANEPPNLDKARAAASRIVQAATQANEIVQRVRGLFKKSTSMTEAVNVNGVIEGTICFVAREAQRKNVYLQTELDVRLPSVSADRVQLQQVILNLMMNGIEAMADLDSEPKTLLIRSGLPNQRELLVSIADTGPGIDAEHAGRLFAPFFTTKPLGIGMGLPISRSIIEAHGGRLWADKNEPRGAMFHFTLPLKTPKE